MTEQEEKKSDQQAIPGQEEKKDELQTKTRIGKRAERQKRDLDLLLDLDYKRGSRTVILDYCNDRINFYENIKTRKRVYFQISTIISVILSTVLPLLISESSKFQNPTEPWQIALQLSTLIAPIIVALLIGIENAFKIKDSYLRASLTSEKLKAEMALYLIQVGSSYSDKDETQATRNFAANVIQIVLSETTDWVEQMKEKAEKQTIGKANEGKDQEGKADEVASEENQNGEIEVPTSEKEQT